MKYINPIRSHKVKTGKVHSCEWCGEDINQGSDSWYRYYKNEKLTLSKWMHLDCRKAMYNITEYQWDCLGWEWAHGEFKRGSKKLRRKR